MTEIKVTGCKDCPFFDKQETDCNIASNDNVIDCLRNYPNAPNNCPLKTEPITVTL